MINENLGGLTRREFLGIASKGAKTAFGIEIARKIGLPLEARANSLFVELNDENYKSEILDYEGPALVLFYRSDFERAPPSKFELEALKIVAQQYDGRGISRFNGKPIKFAVFDINQYNRLPLTIEQKNERLEKLYGLPVEKGVPITLMYIHGKVIDKKVGGPASESGIKNTVHNVTKFWIPSNIIDPNNNFTWLYKGGQLRKYPKGS